MTFLPLFRAVGCAGLVPKSSYRLLGSVRHGSITTWNQDWKPGPYPTTPEMRVAAAKKYGLLVEDYEPWDPKEDSWGDYPRLVDVGGSAKDPYYNWDDPDMKRNFGEPIHISQDCITEDRYEPQSKVKGYWPKENTMFRKARFFLSMFFGFIALQFFTSNFVCLYPLMPRQLPSDLYVKGMKHYTFELKGEGCD